MLKWNEMEWNGMKGNETDKIQSGKLISNKEVFFGTFAELGSMNSFERGSSWATSSHAVQNRNEGVFGSSVFSFWRSLIHSVICFLSGRKEFDLWFVFNLFCLMSIHVLHLVGPMRLKLSFSASRHRLCGAGCRQERAGGISRYLLVLGLHQSFYLCWSLLIWFLILGSVRNPH